MAVSVIRPKKPLSLSRQLLLPHSTVTAVISGLCDVLSGVNGFRVTHVRVDTTRSWLTGLYKICLSLSDFRRFNSNNLPLTDLDYVFLNIQSPTDNLCFNDIVFYLQCNKNEITIYCICNKRNYFRNEIYRNLRSQNT